MMQYQPRSLPGVSCCALMQFVLSRALVVIVCIHCVRDLFFKFDFQSSAFRISVPLCLWWSFASVICPLSPPTPQQILPLFWTQKSQSVCGTWTPSQVQDSTYSPFTFIDLSHPSANQPVKNLILHSFKPAPLKDSLELIGSLSLKRTQGNLMAKVKTASEQAGCIQHAFIIKLSCWLDYR